MTATMKAAVITQPGQLEIRSIDRPAIDDFQALVKIEVCGLCGSTDLHLIDGTQCHHPADWYPAILGHEAVGTVVEIGKKVVKYKLGDRVTRPAAIIPGQHAQGLYSAWGGFAEYGIVLDEQAMAQNGDPSLLGSYLTDRQNVVSPALSPNDASLAISLAEVASWAHKLGPIADKTIFIGGAGFAALAACWFLKLAGAARVVVLARRAQALQHAQRCGADETASLADYDPAALLQKLGQADIFVEAAGAQPVFDLGLQLLQPDGILAIYGAPDQYRYQLNMKLAAGQFRIHLNHAEEHKAYPWVADMITRSAINPQLFYSHTWDSLDQLPRAVAAQRDKSAFKSLITINS